MRNIMNYTDFISYNINEELDIESVQNKIKNGEVLSKDEEEFLDKHEKDAETLLKNVVECSSIEYKKAMKIKYTPSNRLNEDLDLALNMVSYALSSEGFQHHVLPKLKQVFKFKEPKHKQDEAINTIVKKHGHDPIIVKLVKLLLNSSIVKKLHNLSEEQISKIGKVVHFIVLVILTTIGIFTASLSIYGIFYFIGVYGIKIFEILSYIVAGLAAVGAIEKIVNLKGDDLKDFTEGFNLLKSIFVKTKEA